MKPYKSVTKFVTPDNMVHDTTKKATNHMDLIKKD